MPRKPETLFKDRFVKEIGKINQTSQGMIWIVKTQQVAIVGTPDLLLCVNGKFMAIELKATSRGKASRLQAHNLSLVNAAQGLGMVVHPDNMLLALEVIAKWAYGFNVPESLLATARG